MGNIRLDFQEPVASKGPKEHKLDPNLITIGQAPKASYTL